MDATEQDKKRERAALKGLFDARVTNPRERAAFLRRREAELGCPTILNSSMVNQHLSGNRPISLDAALRYCRAFEVPLDALSPRWAAMVHEALPHLDNRDGASRPQPLRPAWPFPRIDEKLLSKLTERETRIIENEILETGLALRVDIRKRRSA